MEPFIAQIVGFGFNFAPRGWAFCAGQLLSIQQNAALFSILGTTYGGNGIQTFGLPDLRGRVPVNWGQGPGLASYTLGQISGTQSVTILSNQLPLHNHTFLANNAPATSGSPSGNYLGKGAAEAGANVSMFGSGSATGSMSGSMLSLTGGNQPVSIIKPYTVINYCVALQGIFPSRN